MPDSVLKPSLIQQVPPEALEASLHGVSPDSILALVSNRLESLDVQIGERASEIMRHTDVADGLSERLQVLEAIAAVANDNDGNKVSWTNTAGSAEHLIEMNGVTYNSARELAHEFGVAEELDQFVDGGKLKASEVQGAADQIRQELERANSGNELEMMFLQRLIQQRSEAISLASNLMRKMDQANDSIIRNLGV